MIFPYLGAHSWASVLLFVIFGLLVGSFLNVVIYRLPLILTDLQYRYISEALIEDGEKQLVTGIRLIDRAFQRKEFDKLLYKEKVLPVEGFLFLSFPRSSCPRCGHEIRWYENIPVFSWLLLGGKCSCCHLPISFQYPLVELLSGVLTGIVGYQYGISLEGLGYILLIWSLLALTIIDFKHLILPDHITLPILWLGLILSYMEIINVPFSESFWGCILGYLSLWVINRFSLLLYKKEGIGHGDFKLLAMLGAWLGMSNVLLILLLSSAVGALCGLGLIFAKKAKRNTYIPFGPYLSLAGLIVFYFQLDLSYILDCISA